MSAFATQNPQVSVKNLRCEKDNLNLLSIDTGQNAERASDNAVLHFLFLGLRRGNEIGA